MSARFNLFRDFGLEQFMLLRTLVQKTLLHLPGL
jgi:hypothetical protein